MKSTREYKSGSRWAAWRWTYTPGGYLTRLFLLKTPWFAICLHWLLKPDPEPYVHDHPVSLLSLILRGGYVEERLHDNGTLGFYKHRWFNWLRSTTKHSIIQVSPKTLTLAFMGPKRQDWGFFKYVGHRANTNGPAEPIYDKIDWREYNDAKYKRGEEV